MNFLEEIGFSKDAIEEINETVPEKIKEMIISGKKLVTENILYLKELGIKNYEDIFIRYYDIFLMDNSNFVEMFSKYEIPDLIDKLSKNISIVDYL